MDLVYGIPALAALLFAFAHVRRIARRERLSRTRRLPQPPRASVRTLSQRSEMHAGDAISVMDDLQRTSQRLASPVSVTPSKTSTASAAKHRARSRH